jgi:pyruvate dehydrogenase (quinone)
MATTVADQLIEVLMAAGVRRVYGVVGDSLNPVVDGIRRAAGIEWVGAFAAAAEAQLTGRLAVCAGSCGPGNTHLIQGLYDAHRSGAPVLALASQIPTSQVGPGFFQETHPERLFVEASGYCEMVSQPAQMPRLARTAIQHALGRNEVAVLVLPGDVAALEAGNPTGHAVKVVVFNNSSLGMVKLEMLVAGLPDSGVDLTPVDFAAIATAIGIRAWRVSEPGGIRDALGSALAHDGPALVDLITDSNALSIPPHLAAAQVRGFALAATKTVLEGGVGKMLELARANLRNIPRP